MTLHRNPGNSGTCPFYIDPDDVFTAEASIRQCVTCATQGCAGLESHREDFRQLAYLTILEETPKYDPVHPSRASFITFIKSRVCSRLWAERRKEQKYQPCAVIERPMSEAPIEALSAVNPLMAQLYRDACALELLEDSVIDEIQVNRLREHLPAILQRLTEKEQKAVRLKYFQDYTGTQIAAALGVSQGRVSQVLKSALSKLKTAYQRLEDGYPV